MVKRMSLLALALVGVASVAQAQTATGPAPGPVDPNGRPYIGANDWRPGPGDPQYSKSAGAMSQAGQAESQMQAPMAPQDQSQAMAPGSLEKPTMKDEYGFMYNSRGDRVDANGRIMAPPVTPPGAAAR